MLRHWDDPLMVTNLAFLFPALVFREGGMHLYAMLYVCIFVASNLYHRWRETRFLYLDMTFAGTAFAVCILHNFLTLNDPGQHIINAMCVLFYPVMCRICGESRCRRYQIVHSLWHVFVSGGSAHWAFLLLNQARSMKQSE